MLAMVDANIIVLSPLVLENFSLAVLANVFALKVLLFESSVLIVEAIC